MQTPLKLEKDMTIEEIKAFIGRLKKDIKNVEKGALRKVFLNEILDLDSAYENEKRHTQNFKEKMETEKKRAREFLYNEEEAEKAGWNYTGNKKALVAEYARKQLEWADKAYPKFTVELWDAQRDLEECIAILKSI